jgi:hypothetical protein
MHVADEVDRSYYTHPWARQGSKASKNVGAQRWFVGENKALLPTAREMVAFRTAVENDSDFSSVVSSVDVEAFFASIAWSWIRVAHDEPVENHDWVATVKLMEQDYGANKLRPVDLIALNRDAPLFFSYLFPNIYPNFFSVMQVDENDMVEQVIRVGIQFDYDMVNNGVNLASLLVSEPTPLLLSFIALRSQNETKALTIKTLSNAGLSFDDFAEALKMFVHIPYLPYESLEDGIGLDLFGVFEEPHIPDGVLDSSEAFARWLYDAYLRHIKKIDTEDLADIPLTTILSYAASGVFKPLRVIACCENEIDPEIARELFPVDVDNETYAQ